MIDMANSEQDKQMYFNHEYALQKMAKIPIRLTDPDAVGERLREFLELCSKDGVMPTVPGLALAMGTSAGELMKTQGTAMLRAKQTIENITVHMMEDNRMPAQTGTFLLKNWFGYKDQSNIAISASSTVTTTEEIEKKYANVDLIESGDGTGKGLRHRRGGRRGIAVGGRK